LNKESISKFKNLKSQDLQILSGERGSRLLKKSVDISNHNHNFSLFNNNLNSILNSFSENLHNSQNNLFDFARLN
jgi:hypothetical protein